jgi:ribonuclease HI
LLDFVYTDGSKKGGSSPLGAAATHPASDTRIKILVTSTPPSHTINRAELAGIDIGLQLGHTHLLTNSACSLRLIQGYLNSPSAYRHNIHRDTLLSITHTLKTRCDALKTTPSHPQNTLKTHITNTNTQNTPNTKHTNTPNTPNTNTQNTLKNHTLKTHTPSTPSIRTHLGKIKAHNHSLGNDLIADTLANQVADRHHVGVGNG